MINCEPYKFTVCYINLWLFRIVSPSQLIVGTIGNILNIVILSRRRIRKYSTTVYLLCLAISDMGVLWSAALTEFMTKAYGVPIRTYSNFNCKISWWLAYTSSGFSIWLLVLMTVERTILTRSPIVARTSLSRRNASIFAISTLLFWLCFTGHLLYGFEVKTLTIPVANGNYLNETVFTKVSLCIPVGEYRNIFTKVWPRVVIISMVTLPFVCLIIGNGTILVTLLLQQRRLNKVNPTNSTENAGNTRATRNRRSSTKTLITISTFFILTHLPFAINLIVSRHIVDPDPYKEAVRDFVNNFVFMLSSCNCTFNFVLYFVSGTLFKQEWNAFLKETRLRFRRILRQTVPVAGITTITGDSSMLHSKHRTGMSSGQGTLNNTNSTDLTTRCCALEKKDDKVVPFTDDNSVDDTPV